MQMMAMPTVNTPSTRLVQERGEGDREWDSISTCRSRTRWNSYSQEPPPACQPVSTIEFQDGDRQERSEGVPELRTAVQDGSTEGELFLAERSTV